MSQSKDIQKGDVVTRNGIAEWGEGVVIEVLDSGQIRVEFKQSTPKNQVVFVDEVTPAGKRQDVRKPGSGRRQEIDFDRAYRLCDEFIRELEGNRSNSDDAGVARLIKSELQSGRRVKRSTAKRLAKWCTTNGNIFVKGAPLAQDISMAIFGRILQRDEFE